MVGGWCYYDEICCGVVVVGVSDGDGVVFEIDGCIVDFVLRWFQGCDCVVNFSCVCVVVQGIFVELVGS